MSELNSINQLHIIDIYRLLHPTTVEYTLFSSTHGIFPKMGHKIHGNKFKIEINYVELNYKLIT